MFCKNCGVDIGQGYPEVRFCHMCGVDLAPKENPVFQHNAGVQFQKPMEQLNNETFQQPVPVEPVYNHNEDKDKRTWEPKVKAKQLGGSKFSFKDLSFAKRALPKEAHKPLLIGAVICLLSLFFNWLAPYTYSNSISVPRSQDIYHRNDYGDLESIETRRWNDKYHFGSTESGTSGIGLPFGFLTFLAAAGTLVSVFYSVENGLPSWGKYLPRGAFIYMLVFWIIMLIAAFTSQGGPAFGVFLFPAGLFMINRGNKKLKKSA